MTTYIQSLGTAVPEHRYAQEDLLQFMLRTLPLPEALATRLGSFYAHSGIAHRHSVLADFGQGSGELFAAQSESAPAPDLAARMAVYQREALPLALSAVRRAVDSSAYELQDLTHLLAVSCTGLSAPGLDLMLLRALELSPRLQRSCLYFMGCYAALHALKQAHAICQADPQAVVLIVCVELCTLHFQYAQDLDSLTSSMLFADGAAAAIISRRPAALEIQGFFSEVALQGWDEMSWDLSPSGFLMKLGAGVPSYLEQAMGPLVERACHALGWEQLERWALHPGGRKILDLAQESLGVSASDLAASYAVLRRYGNMSSPTVLFVLQELMQQSERSLRDREKIFAAAFGPGLTLEALGLQYHS